MDCDSALELISMEIDGLLTPEEQTALETHLAECQACRSLRLELAALHAAMPAEDEPPQGFTQSVMERVRAEKVVPLTPGRSPWGKWRSWAAMAAVFAVVVAGVGGLQKFMVMGRSGGASGNMAPATSMYAAPAAGNQSQSDESAGATARNGQDPSSEMAETGDSQPADQENAPAARSSMDKSAPEPQPVPEPGAVPAETPKVDEGDAQSAVFSSSQIEGAEDGNTGPVEDTVGAAAGGGAAQPRMFSARPSSEEITPPEGGEGDAAEPEEPGNSGTDAGTDKEGGAPTALQIDDPELTSCSLESPMTPREALDLVMEQTYVPPEAQVVDTEGFLGWQTPSQTEEADPEAGQISTQLQYLGLSPNGKYHEFWLSNFLVDDPSGGLAHSSTLNFYAVPLEGGEILIQRQDYEDLTDEAQFAAYLAGIQAYLDALSS